jgi:hypothetical protein
MNALEKSTPLRTSSVRDPARSKGEFTKSTDHELCLGYLRSDDCDPAPEMSQFPDDSYYSAATSRIAASALLRKKNRCMLSKITRDWHCS